MPDDAAIESGGTPTYPFDIPLFTRGEFDFRFSNSLTIFVGENGSGKSTLLEAIATLAGFSEGGGGRGHSAVDRSARSGSDGDVLGEALRAAWLPKIGNGLFFRAETFFTLARYLDDVGSPMANYLAQSHGEGFLDFFAERCSEQGIYIFDEPEAALSPSRQFEFVKMVRAIQRADNAQLVIATHSPILMAIPGAELLAIDRYGIRPIALEDTGHYRLYREFVLYPSETIEAMTE